MAGFDDVILAALPYLCTERIPAAGGTTWWWEYEVHDSNNDLVPLSTGFTITAAICTTAGALVASPSISHPSTGVIRCTVDAADSALVQPGTYNHEVTIVRDSDSAEVLIVGAGGGTFVVQKRVS